MLTQLYNNYNKTFKYELLLGLKLTCFKGNSIKSNIQTIALKQKIWN